MVFLLTFCMTGCGSKTTTYKCAYNGEEYDKGTMEAGINKMSKEMLVEMFGSEEITKEDFIKNAEEQGSCK